MSIIFSKIRWMNFLSTGNDFTEISLDTAGTTLIVGANGHGKSTVLDALCFVLYNKSFRKINKPALINSINNKNCLVEIEFKSGKDEYRVRRGMKPNVFEIFKNGDLINQEAANRDYQEILESHILKMTYKSFCQVVILGSASFVPFMQLPTGQRREIIEDLLDIQIFTVMNMLLKDKMGQNSKLLLDVDYRTDLTSEKMKMQEDHLRSMLSNTQDLIDACEEKIAKYEKEIENEKLIIEEKRTEQSSLISDTRDHETLSRKVVEMGNIIGKLNDRIDRLNSDIKFFTANDDCPTCRQVISPDFKNATILSKKKEIEEVGSGAKSIKDMYDESSSRVESMKKILRQIGDIDIDINMRSGKIKQIRNSIKDLNEQIDSLNAKSSTYVGDNDSLKSLEEELRRINQEKKDLLEIKEMHRVSSAILKDGGIKAKIIKQYIPVINKLINKYLAAMDFFIQFELDENFNETIKSRFRDDFSYSSFSEGEKTRIDLALLFAWRAIAKIRNSASTNLLVLDEIFDGSLDATGSDDFLNILYSVAGEANIFVISHKTDQLRDKFDRVITFEKKNNFSRIVEAS